MKNSIVTGGCLVGALITVWVGSYVSIALGESWATGPTAVSVGLLALVAFMTYLKEL